MIIPGWPEIAVRLPSVTSYCMWLSLDDLILLLAPLNDLILFEIIPGWPQIAVRLPSVTSYCMWLSLDDLRLLLDSPQWLILYVIIPGWPQIAVRLPSVTSYCMWLSLDDLRLLLDFSVTSYCMLLSRDDLRLLFGSPQWSHIVCDYPWMTSDCCWTPLNDFILYVIIPGWPQIAVRLFSVISYCMW